MARVLVVATAGAGRMKTEVLPTELDLGPSAADTRASPASIGEAVTRVLDDDGMRETAEHNAMGLQLTDPPGVAAGLIEGLL